jgi:hypothetical protein
MAPGDGHVPMGAYVAAPGERVLQPFVATSLFPYLEGRSRRAFRIGLASLLLVLIALALLRWQAPLIAVCVIGLPLIFVLYFFEIGVRRDLTTRSLVPTAVFSVLLGLGWALWSGSVSAGFYDVTLGESVFTTRSVLVAVAIPVGAAVLMLVPVVAMKLLHPTRTVLDGFLIGALAAVCFTAAATLTRLAPQFATGLIADRPVSVLVIQAGLQGVAVPLIATLFGGLVGAALWFGRPGLIASSVGVMFVVYGGLGLLELAPILASVLFVVYAVVTVFALLALRIGLQTALLHERKVPVVDSGTGHSAAAESARQASHQWLYTSLGAGVIVAAAMGVTAATVATPARPRYTCPPDCGRPPIGEPVELNPRFFSTDQRFSVQYPGPESAYKATLKPNGVDLDYYIGDTGTMQLFGVPAENRSPKTILDELVDRSYPEASVAYEIPNAMVGYQPGYGEVLDEYPQDTSGDYTRLRIVALCAVKDDYALIAAAVGPYHEFTPDFGTGHPSGVNMALALDMGKYVNSFRWRNRPE